MFNFKSLKIKSTLLPSNVFFAPINPGYAYNGIINNKFCDFFLERSNNDIGICYIGNVSICNDYKTNDKTAVFVNNESEIWKELVYNIESRGSRSGIQLAWKPSELMMQRDFVSKNKTDELYKLKEFYKKFNDFEIVSDYFAYAINMSSKIGFSIAQIHAAHGYALSILLSRTISECIHPEQTKGIKLIKKIVSKCDLKNIIFDIRLSLFEGFEDSDCELNYKLALFKILKKCGFDIISLSNGMYNINKDMIYPPKKNGNIMFGKVKEIAENNLDVVWNLAGNMESVIFNNIKIPDNMTISIGRQLITDSKTIFKVRNNLYKDVHLCSECNKCHYYSYGLDGIQPCDNKSGGYK